MVELQCIGEDVRGQARPVIQHVHRPAGSVLWFVVCLVLALPTVVLAQADSVQVGDSLTVKLGGMTEPVVGVVEEVQPEDLVVRFPSGAFLISRSEIRGHTLFEPEIDRPGVRQRSEWYGHHVFYADLSALVIALLAQSPELAVLGWFASPLVVHTVRGNPRSAVLSPILRASLPMAGGEIGANSADCPDGTFLCGLGEAITGIALGGLVSLVIDYTVLSVKKKPTGRRSLTDQPQIAPILMASRRGLRIGAAARFM